MKANKEMLEMAILRGFDDIDQIMFCHPSVQHYHFPFDYDHTKHRVDNLTEVVLNLNKYLRELDQIKQAEGKQCESE